MLGDLADNSVRVDSPPPGIHFVEALHSIAVARYPQARPTAQLGLSCGLMPDTHLRLRLPDKCPACNVVGCVIPETTVTGATVLLTWCCRSCGHTWPISEREQETAERRLGPRERRQIARGDRRLK